jgi:transcriptional regulator with XRE-family HTH domain
MPRPRREDAPKRTATTLGTNLRRLLGVHGLTSVEAAQMVGLSPQAMSELGWRENPSSETLAKLSDFFEIEMSRLLRTPLLDLLPLIAERERFKRVEAKIRRRRAHNQT